MKTFASIMKYAGSLAFSVVLGSIVGSICGAAILSFCALSGRSGTTGDNYIGFWDYGVPLVGSMYGAPLGAILGPIAYVAFVRRIGFKQATIFGTAGTILGGSAGALIVPGLGVPAGIAGFFIALIAARMSHSPPVNGSQA